MELKAMPESGVLPPPRQRTAHVVFALSPQERRLFFSGEPHLAGDVELLTLDTRRTAPEFFEAALRRTEPTVLLTAWSCPRLPEEWLAEPDCPLLYVCSVTGAVRSRIPREFIERGGLVSNWGGIASRDVAEHALLMVMGLLRGVRVWNDLLISPRSMFDMMPRLRSRPLRGKRVGLHGFGGVARELVALLRSFDVKLAAYSPGVPASFYEEFGVEPCASLEELFSRSEILVECEALNEQSRQSVTGEVLRLLPHDAVFVNVARGDIVEEEALVALAREGRLRVGLDVLRSEPADAEVLERLHPDSLISPHIAGPTWESYPLCGQQALENVERFLSGDPITNRVTLEIYDRST